MRKIIVSFLTLIIFAVVMTGCTINLDGKELTLTQGSDSNSEKKAEKIEVTIDKHYEDGFDLKVQLSHADSAKGTWTVKYCGLEDIQKDKGNTIITGFGYSDCTEDANYEDVYINFTGEANGKKITVDKVYVLTEEELDKVPLEREQPTVWDDIRNFSQSGELNNAVTFGATKEEVIKFWGEPTSTSDDGTALDYEHITFSFDANGTLVNVTFRNTKDSPIDVSMEEIEKAFGQPVESDGAAGTYYSKYQLEKSTVVVAWSNVESRISRIEVSAK
ncbi:DUF4309 domain-containing protein [Shimazuella kribbensis]|uniref:DUF4309 domain-containing protein n=1 Tax=Shimazuella kribbensis TaxID=139808 RepID=UPI0004001DA1|nr:DUF4309 domain-containing protein [Shimazuella kribbensis]